MKIVRKYSSVILIIIILFLIVTLLVKNKSIAESTEKINVLQTEIKDTKKEDTKKEDIKKDTNSSETFDEDLKWFVSKTFETNNTLQVYEDIKDSVSQEVLEALLGDELPPKESNSDETGMIREATNIDVFGKYENDEAFKAVVLFDLDYKFKDQEDSRKVLASVEITKQKGSWIITKFEELN